MRYHDYHLRGYSVRDFGERVVLDLVYDYPPEEPRESRIEFSGVACYFFEHPEGAIITDIEEVDVGDLAAAQEHRLISFARQYGLRFWDKDLSTYIDTLRKERCRAWRIDSAIGFGGWVIARAATGNCHLQGAFVVEAGQTTECSRTD